MHETRGAIRLAELVSNVVGHEREHLDQIESALAGPA
jgi:hypothetical protein